jgi:hypothetical protein
MVSMHENILTNLNRVGLAALFLENNAELCRKLAKLLQGLKFSWEDMRG